MAASSKIIVIDDDPTGSQTVHSCPLLLRWDAATLAAGLRHPSPLLFLLANTRALAPEAAAERVRQICRALAAALPLAGIERWWLVSRGDSTLRGHFPLEVEVIAAELGPFAATLLIPAFFEGGPHHRGGGASPARPARARDRLRPRPLVWLHQQRSTCLGGGKKRGSYRRSPGAASDGRRVG